MATQLTLPANWTAHFRNALKEAKPGATMTVRFDAEQTEWLRAALAVPDEHPKAVKQIIRDASGNIAEIREFGRGVR